MDRELNKDELAVAQIAATLLAGLGQKRYGLRNEKGFPVLDEHGDWCMSSLALCVDVSACIYAARAAIKDLD